MIIWMDVFGLEQRKTYLVDSNHEKMHISSYSKLLLLPSGTRGHRQRLVASILKVLVTLPSAYRSLFVATWSDT